MFSWESGPDLEGSRSDEGDVVVVQRQRLEGRQRPERSLRQELEPVLVHVDGGRLAGELLGQLSEAGAVAQDAAALLLSARAGGGTGPDTRPPGQRRRGQQAQDGHWGQDTRHRSIRGTEEHNPTNCKPTIINSPPMNHFITDPTNCDNEKTSIKSPRILFFRMPQQVKTAKRKSENWRRKWFKALSLNSMIKLS